MIDKQIKDADQINYSRITLENREEWNTKTQ
jgi:hypothetical protein